MLLHEGTFQVIKDKESLPFTVLTESRHSVVVFQSLSRVRLFATPWTAAHQASLSFTVSQSLLKLLSSESVMPSNHLILCRPLLLPPSVFPSIRIFSNELVFHITWPKYWSFSFSISPCNGYSGLISFRVDWLDLLAIQGTLKSLLQHQLSEITQTHVHRVRDAIQPSHPMLTPSPPKFNLSHHQGLFKC